ncbi:MAG TPA: NAD(+) diphosphatase [Beutenbergiaceae bacterium]|nr:NAD(+) diphosphatase [Beutenbergiaceae bacterium]
MDSDELPLGRSTIDRDALIRTDPRELRRVWADPRLQMMHVSGSDVAVRGERLELTEVPGEVRASGGESLTWAYLGKDHLGPVIAAVHLAREAGRAWANLRTVGALLPGREAGLATAAVALANWHATHTHCPRCGAATTITASGWVRVCPVDNSEHFPRTDAAVIMAIIDSFDRILLAHNAMWPANRFSVPAGYVEPGEPLEAAVRREVWEETAIRVGRVAYQGSQPWPFPASLMVAFRGEALNAEPIADGEEITEVRFFTRAELAHAVAAGDLLLPGATSIARSLIEDWYGGPIPGA